MAYDMAIDTSNWKAFDRTDPLDVRCEIERRAATAYCTRNATMR